MNVYQWLCVIGVPSVITLIWTTIIKKSLDKAARRAEESERRAEEDRQRSLAIENGLRDVLRIQILDTYDKCVQNGRTITVSRKDAIDSAYRSYHALGGNGTITQAHEEIMEMQIVS